MFIKSMYRNIKRNPLFNIINLIGLVLGFVCIIFITIWIKNELSYDRFHKNSDNIYRVHRYFYDSNGTENLHLSNVAPIIAPLMKNEFTEIQYISRIYHLQMLFVSGNQKILENKVCFAEPELINIFDFEGLPADNKLLKDPYTVIVTDEMADKYFHNQNIIGKSLEFKDEKGEKHKLQIVGVFKKWKNNSHFNPDFFISFSTYESLVSKEELLDWSSNNYETYALIPHLSIGFDKKLDAFIDKHLNNGSKWTKIRLESLSDIHFNWYSSRSYIYILISIALLILIIGSINYMNLNAAMYSKRLTEIRIKKIIGASPKKLAFQLLSETVLFCFISLLFAIYIISLALPKISQILQNPLDFDVNQNISLILGFVGLAILTGIISGIYPALILTSYKPITTSTLGNIRASKASFRNSLVVFQFVVSIVLIISFSLVSKQLNYINNKELGLNKEDIVVIPTTPLLIEKLDAFKHQLSSNPNILSVSGSKRVPSDGLWDCNGANIFSEGKSIPLEFRLANVRMDEQFIPTYKIKLLAGRNFDKDFSKDFGFIINECAVKKIGWKSPENAIGQVIEYGGIKGNVIGVVNDFHYESLHTPISPIIMFNDPTDFNLVSIRLAPSERNSTLEFIEKTWQAYNVSDLPYLYEYLNDNYKRLYKAEEIIKTIFSYFMFLAISIAILGLVGLSVFLIEGRKKEIGIRKVNGAKIIEVMAMLNKDFIKWVAIAFIIACPIAYYTMHKWLENFAYKTELSWWVFASAGLTAITIALFTVSWQSYKAATRNPVEALRSE